RWFQVKVIVTSGMLTTINVKANTYEEACRELPRLTGTRGVEPSGIVTPEVQMKKSRFSVIRSLRASRRLTRGCWRRTCANLPGSVWRLPTEVKVRRDGSIGFKSE